MENSEKIVLTNMVYSGRLGVAEWERETPTRIEVDLEICADLGSACKSDSLSDTIDYVRIHDLVGEVIGARHHNLVESLAEDISDAVFGVCECEKVVVRIRKPHPPLNGPCDYAAVEIVRHKKN